MQTGANRRVSGPGASDRQSENNITNNTSPSPGLLAMSDSDDDELDKEAVGRAVGETG